MQTGSAVLAPEGRNRFLHGCWRRLAACSCHGGIPHIPQRLLHLQLLDHRGEGIGDDQHHQGQPHYQDEQGGKTLLEVLVKCRSEIETRCDDFSIQIDHCLGLVIALNLNSCILSSFLEYVSLCNAFSYFPSTAAAAPPLLRDVHTDSPILRRPGHVTALRRHPLRGHSRVLLTLTNSKI